jgi:hypothetical protein
MVMPGSTFIARHAPRRGSATDAPTRLILGEIALPHQCAAVIGFGLANAAVIATALETAPAISRVRAMRIPFFSDIE